MIRMASGPIKFGLARHYCTLLNRTVYIIHKNLNCRSWNVSQIQFKGLLNNWRIVMFVKCLTFVKLVPCSTSYPVPATFILMPIIKESYSNASVTKSTAWHNIAFRRYQKGWDRHTSFVITFRTNIILGSC